MEPDNSAVAAKRPKCWTLSSLTYNPGAVCCCVSSTELPVVVEKLRLSESSGEEQELVDDEELQRFRELKHKMTLLDEAELGSAAPRNNRRLFPATTR